jgi:molybdate transport system substrate-binding protein
LLGAKSIAYSREGASGVYFAGLLERLGIAEAMKGRTRRAAGNVAELVALGEVEMAVQLVPELIAVPGVELAGPFPPELQNYVVFAAAVGVRAKQREPGRALIGFLTQPEAIPVIKSKGMEPG